MKLHEKASLAFVGLVYVIMGILILRFPKFLYYWVAGVFIFHGVISLLRFSAK